MLIVLNRLIQIAGLFQRAGEIGFGLGITRLE